MDCLLLLSVDRIQRWLFIEIEIMLMHGLIHGGFELTIIMENEQLILLSSYLSSAEASMISVVGNYLVTNQLLLAVLAEC
jgi:hypothetical protein